MAMESSSLLPSVKHTTIQCNSFWNVQDAYNGCRCRHSRIAGRTRDVCAASEKRPAVEENRRVSCSDTRELEVVFAAADSVVMEEKPHDKEAIAINILVKGHPQAYAEFFTLTHDSSLDAIKPSLSNKERDEAQKSQGTGEIGSDLLPVLSRQLIRAEIGVERNDQKCVFDAYNTLAGHFEQVENMDRALHFHERSLAAARAGGCEEEETSANLAMGLVHQQLGDVENAGAYLDRFLSLSSSAGVQDENEVALQSLMQVYTKKGEKEETVGHLGTAIQWFLKSTEFAEKARDWNSLGHINYRLGVLHQQLEDYQKALHFHSNYLDASRKAKDKEAEGRAYCGMAECHQELGDLAKSIMFLETYLDISRMEDPEGQARACCNLGVIYYTQDRFEQAVTYFEKCFEVARTLGNQLVLDVARINLGVARGAARMMDYLGIVKEDLPSLLQWKNNRMPFSERI